MVSSLALIADQDPLALDQDWQCPVALTPFQQALEATVFRSGLSRQDWLLRLAGQLHHPGLLPLLWLLPHGWRLAPAHLPQRLQALAAVLEEGLLSPGLLAALVDDLPHLLPSAPRENDALSLWSRTAISFGGERVALPVDRVALEALIGSNQELGGPDRPQGDESPGLAAATDLSGGLVWRNHGMLYSQGPQRRRANALLAQLLNRLAANQLPAQEVWRFDGCHTTARQAITALRAQGWAVEGRLRASVASFGLGASLRDGPGDWRQVPIGLPLRTGLCAPDGSDVRALLPHTALELRLRSPAGELLLAQYYQGTEGLCGWEGLNDLHRPWQNDPENGTVRYLEPSFRDDRLLDLLDLSEAMALVHNRLASGLGLRYGGYGSLGFCIDTTALLQQALLGRCDLFPVLLSGIWRERLSRVAEASQRALQQEADSGPGDTNLLAGRLIALERYRDALQALPLDLSHHGSSCADAWRRLKACQPLSSPFQLVRQVRTA